MPRTASLRSGALVAAITCALLTACSASAPPPPPAALTAAPTTSAPAAAPTTAPPVGAALTPVAAMPTVAVAQPASLSFRLDWIPNVQHFGPVYAAHQGLYKDVGLQVDVQPGGQADPLQLLAAGSVDVVVSGPTQIYVANEHGLNVVGFAAVFQKSPQVMVCRGDRGITTFQDLTGKTIGSKGPPDMDTLPPLFARNGIDASNVKITPIGANSVTEIIAGLVDCQLAYATNEPIIMEKAGVTPVVFYLADLGFGGQAEVYTTRADYLARNPDVLKRFLQATGNAWGTLLDDPESAGQWVVDSQIVDGLDVDEQRKEAVAQAAMIADDYTQQHGILAINPDLWQQQAQQALDQGRIAQLPDMSKNYTQGVLDAAALPHR